MCNYISNHHSEIGELVTWLFFKQWPEQTVTLGTTTLNLGYLILLELSHSWMSIIEVSDGFLDSIWSRGLQLSAWICRKSCQYHIQFLPRWVKARGFSRDTFWAAKMCVCGSFFRNAQQSPIKSTFLRLCAKHVCKNKLWTWKFINWYNHGSNFVVSQISSNGEKNIIFQSQDLVMLCQSYLKLFTSLFWSQTVTSLVKAGSFTAEAPKIA